VFAFEYPPTSDIIDETEMGRIGFSGATFEKHDNLITIKTSDFTEFQRLLLLSVVLGTIKYPAIKHKAVIIIANLDPSTTNCWYNFLINRYEIPKQDGRDRLVKLAINALKVYIGLAY
ncbi:MAG: hypothetical protein ACP5IE_10515, partial [Infirmifilum sp.]